MTVCKFFMQGYCKYGSSCRFEHQSGGNAGYAYTAQRQLFGGGNRGGGQSFGGGGGRGGGNRGGGGNRFQQNPYKWQASDNKQATAQMSTNDVINTLISEITEWESNKMWPFSCIAFEKECPCIPDFTDTSPEELRTAAYEALQSGSLQSYIQHEQTLTEEYKQKRLQVKNLNLTMKNKLISLIEDYRLSKTKSGSSTSGSVSLFSKTASTAFGTTGNSNPFASAGTGSSNAFGATGTSPLASAGTGSSNAFGATGTSPLASAGTGSSNAFGATGTSPFASAGTGSSNAFGATGTTPFGASSASSAFGASGQSFGATSGAFNAQQTFSATNSQFNSQQTFGTSNQIQGQENKTFAGFSGSAFGSQSGSSPLNVGAQTNQTVSAFGQGSSITGFQSTQSGFGSSVGSSTFGNQSQTTGLFGKPASSPAANLFGSLSSQSSDAFSSATSSGFQISGTSSSGFPSAGASSDRDCNKYTPLDQLTPEELEAFQAPTFTLGKIPTRPPPKELVY